jgi:hypothetical protein
MWLSTFPCFFVADPPKKQKKRSGLGSHLFLFLYRLVKYCKYPFFVPGVFFLIKREKKVGAFCFFGMLKCGF